MSASTRHFVRHYVEMVIAMFLGMAVLGVPAGRVLGDSAGMELLGMGVTMTVPMVAWMRYRGHGRQPCLEMSASMLLPAAGGRLRPSWRDSEAHEP